jgi:hypothetical protein
LRDGKFCGHGEPTYSVFDVVHDGERELQISISATEDKGTVRFLIRPAHQEKDWVVLFSRSWSDEARVPKGIEVVRAGESQPSVHPNGSSRFHVAVGLEYPPDCASENEITWIAIAVQAVDGLFREILCSEEFP